ncbi:cobalt/nickel transport system permease protein [Natranaerovirga pectinivora]|uniref:Cobalt/nickel transport system permease protein n=1 Tax=Natranaerovirga pectinivora TaxID=682400 RepID=A0A4R3MRE4_9FIRM|nr:energy-coupling factor transporter transmembrane component T [Natranaerovirga pectinivora]TCT16758.1 cobalt/nickel transport system permease protein [Natranaerovirga pectinivora]
MHIADIDYISTFGRSFFHKARPISKVIFSILLLFSMITTDSIYYILSIIGLMIVFTGLARIPFKQMIHLLGYPLFFSIIFALVFIGQSREMMFLIMGRAVGAAYILVFLIMTTSYTELFGFFSLFMPTLLVDVFIFTYRSLFILLEATSKLFRSIKLRGGYHPLRIVMNMKNMASMIGVLIIHSLEMSERMYNIYSLRGYKGAVNLRRITIWPLGWNDYFVLFAGLASVAWRFIIWK